MRKIKVDKSSSNGTVLSKEDKVKWDHTPIKNRNSRRRSQNDSHAREGTVNAVLLPVQELTRMDDQTLRFIHFEKRLKKTWLPSRRTKKTVELQSEVELLMKENSFLKSACDEHGHYKRKMNLRLAGLREKEDENVRET